MTKKLTSIRSLSLEELKSFLEAKNIPKFRSKQIYEWLWKKNAGSFLEMKNIGKNLQEVLSENFSIDKIALKDEQLSNDKTLKCAFSIDFQLNTGSPVPAEIPTVTRSNFSGAPA